MLMPAFARFPEEAKLVGAMVTGYGELEFSLAHCVSQIIKSQDVTFKVMFRARGEEQRVILADALARPTLTPGAYMTAFAQCIAGMRACLAIRNQYAHCQWGDDARGLWFVALEEIAKDNGAIDLTTLTQTVVDLSALQEQERYFAHIGQRLDALNFDIRVQRGELQRAPFPIPAEIARPPKLPTAQTHSASVPQ
jgi:hypothetical protein